MRHPSNRVDRAIERPRTGRAQAARNRPERPGHRSRAHRLPEHRTDSHQQDLRQARCEQPSGSGPHGPATRPDATNPRPLIPAHGRSRSAGTATASRRLVHARERLAAWSLLITQHLPLLFSTLTTSRSGNIITSINTCADASSSHLLLPFDQATETSATPQRSGACTIGRSAMSDTSTGNHNGAGWYEIRLKGTSTPDGPPGSTG